MLEARARDGVLVNEGEELGVVALEARLEAAQARLQLRLALLRALDVPARPPALCRMRLKRAL